MLTDVRRLAACWDNSETEMVMLMPPSKSILIVEDNDVLRNNYVDLLTSHGFTTHSSASKDEAMKKFLERIYSVIILDVTLGSDYEAGFDLCQFIRENDKLVPIIFLTERDEEHNRISGLRLGADDYLSKTISGTYLAARVNALVRRMQTLLGSDTRKKDEISIGRAERIRIDDRISVAYWQGTALDLSLTQFWILKDLVERAGTVRSLSDLMKAAKITVQPNTIVVHIKSIREEVQKLSPTFISIKSERARGYRWIDDA